MTKIVMTLLCMEILQLDYFIVPELRLSRNLFVECFLTNIETLVTLIQHGSVALECLLI